MTSNQCPECNKLLNDPHLDQCPSCKARFIPLKIAELLPEPPDYRLLTVDWEISEMLGKSLITLIDYIEPKMETDGEEAWDALGDIIGFLRG